MEYVLTAEGLSKSYGKAHVLKDLRMHVPRGAIYGLVGKNGAGKTTLLRLICGLQEPSAGSYSLYGALSGTKEVCAARRRLGGVVETPALYPDMSAQDNLLMQYRILGMPSREGLEELLSLVGLEGSGKKKARHFSLGMRQRLGIAVALAGDPDLLVLDEPINGLDPQGIVEMRELLLRLNQVKGITVLISSHILDELSRLATHYGFIDGGRMVRELSARELEASCRKRVHADVTDTAALARVLEGMGLEYKILSEHTADIFGEVNVSRLARALEEEGCEIRTLSERDEDLESFYISLIGGGVHA